MAKGTGNTENVFNSVSSDIRAGHFAPVYLLMGEEQYYIDKIYGMLMDNVLTETEKDFNLTVFYGADVTGADIANAASRYPMMAERQLVAVREAQSVKKFDDLLSYVASPLDTTVLVLCYMGKSMDKRTSLYKEILKKGVVLESQPVRARLLAETGSSTMDAKVNIHFISVTGEYFFIRSLNITR